jgi:hypothetical protein
VHELRELFISGGAFTWSNNQEVPTLEKLDRILVNKEWEALFPIVHVYKIPRAMSDHNPLILSTQQVLRSRTREFRFELSWIKDTDFHVRIQKIWEEPTRDIKFLDKIQFKLKKVKKFLKGWGYNRAGKGKQKKKKILEELEVIEQSEEIALLDNQTIGRRCTLMAEMLHILEEEELFWFKRSHKT